MLITSWFPRIRYSLAESSVQYISQRCDLVWSSDLPPKCPRWQDLVPFGHRTETVSSYNLLAVPGQGPFHIQQIVSLRQQERRLLLLLLSGTWRSSLRWLFWLAPAHPEHFFLFFSWLERTQMYLSYSFHRWRVWEQVSSALCSGCHWVELKCWLELWPCGGSGPSP